MAARSTAAASAGSRRALLTAAAAGVAAVAVESLARPFDVRAADGDPLLLGASNVANTMTLLASGDSTAFKATGSDVGVNSTGGEYGLIAATQGGGGWPRAIIADGNEGSTGLHAASWAPGGGGGYGNGDALVAETGGGKAVLASAFGSGVGLDASSESGTGGRIRSSSGTALVVESQTGPGASITASGTGIHVDAQGWGVFVVSHHVGNGDPAAIVGNGKKGAPGVVGNSIADDGWIPNGSNVGVHGASGSGVGVRGAASLAGGAGVEGFAQHGTGVRAVSDDGTGLDASGTTTGIHVAAGTHGIVVDCQGTGGDWPRAVVGHGFNNATGIHGRCLAGTSFNEGGANAGVYGESGTGPGVQGSSVSGPGVDGDSPNAVGVRGSGGAAGVLGLSDKSGVAGASGLDPHDVVPPAKTGVYGYAPLDSGGRGVHGRALAGRGVYGQATAGFGLYGYATSGTAVYAGSADPKLGYTLRATGRVKLDRCAGVATVAVGTRSVTVTPGIDITSSSAVVATLQGNAGAGTTVERVSLDTTNDAFTIFLTKNSTATVKVAWHVLG